MSITETGLTYLLLILFMVGCFGGWLLKVAVDQYRADRRRELERERYAEIEKDRIMRWNECQKSAEGLWK